MRPIQMVDLKKQYQEIKADVDSAIHEVLDSAAFINGKAVQDFTQSLAGYLGVKHVVPCANGTDALQIAMMALDLQPGDEVITPSFTYIATTEVVALLQLQPVFVEVDPKTFCIDPAAIEKAITPRTTANCTNSAGFLSTAIFEIIIASNSLCIVLDNSQAMPVGYFHDRFHICCLSI